MVRFGLDCLLLFEPDITTRQMSGCQGKFIDDDCFCLSIVLDV